MPKHDAFTSFSGWTALAALVPAAALCLAVVVLALEAGSPAWLGFAVSGVVLCILLLAGLRRIRPEEAVVLRLFGTYAGTVREPGLRWMNPLAVRRPVPISTRMLETSRIRIEDGSGGEVDLAARVAWRVADAAVAASLDDLEAAVRQGTEEAIRAASCRWGAAAPLPAGSDRGGRSSLMAKELRTHLQSRLAGTGVEIRETRILHVIHRTERPAAELRRQQVAAIVTAWQRIVDEALETA